MKTAASGWVKLDVAVIEESRGENITAQKEMVEARGCSMQRVMEPVVLNLIVFDFVGVQLSDQNAYTRCDEQVCHEQLDEQYTVIVGGFDSVASMSTATAPATTATAQLALNGSFKAIGTCI